MKKQNKEMYDENGVNGYCPAYWEDTGSCLLIIGPRHCHGDGNICPLRHPELSAEHNKRDIKQGLMQIIRENLRNPCRVDLNKISHDIMKKYCVRLRNNIGE